MQRMMQHSLHNTMQQMEQLLSRRVCTLSAAAATATAAEANFLHHVTCHAACVDEGLVWSEINEVIGVLICPRPQPLTQRGADKDCMKLPPPKWKKFQLSLSPNVCVGSFQVSEVSPQVRKKNGQPSLCTNGDIQVGGVFLQQNVQKRGRLVLDQAQCSVRSCRQVLTRRSFCLINCACGCEAKC